MTLRLNIEQITLEGFDLQRSQKKHMQAALQAELSKLFTERGIPFFPQTYHRINSLSLNLEVEGIPNAHLLGKQAAHSIYNNLSVK